ncbi:hypothetical protein [Ornithinimicrobium cerasi]|uniref:Matrixin n=1 Tax=Ornithinimicrobium cerasi TaxID=2248773 RepID=A0A285VMV7_9MICO|nr:hypothetical protein [Ornithinimicrobium cerasi]SOC55293.1 hypothetical protein SAMN05421879_1059 [Ornithinimicrobium cerasi]
MKRFAWRLMALASALTLALSAVVPAQAHYFGGRFPHTAGTWLYLPYTNPLPYVYAGNISQAGSNWYNTPTRLIPYSTTDYSRSKLDFYTGSYGGDWWGMAQNYNAVGKLCYTCTYQWSNLYMNVSTLKYESGSVRTKVATHEAGHGFGLAHTTDWWYSSIMKQGWNGYSTPQRHDVNDVNNLYKYG